MFFNHFYLIKDEETVRHLSQCFKESCVIKMDMEQNVTKPKEITFYKDLPIEEALELPEGSVVIFEKYHLNEEYKQYIDLPNDWFLKTKPFFSHIDLMDSQLIPSPKHPDIVNVTPFFVIIL